MQTFPDDNVEDGAYLLKRVQEAIKAGRMEETWNLLKLTDRTQPKKMAKPKKKRRRRNQVMTVEQMLTKMFGRPQVVQTPIGPFHFYQSKYF